MLSLSVRKLNDWHCINLHVLMLFRDVCNEETCADERMRVDAKKTILKWLWRLSSLGIGQVATNDTTNKRTKLCSLLFELENCLEN